MKNLTTIAIVVLGVLGVLISNAIGMKPEFSSVMKVAHATIIIVTILISGIILIPYFKVTLGFVSSACSVFILATIYLYIIDKETLLVESTLILLYGLVLNLYFGFQAKYENKEKIKTRVTLAKRYENENLLFLKTFNQKFPKIEMIKVLEDNLIVVHSDFNAKQNLFNITAEDMKRDWTEEELKWLEDDGWECKNVMYIQKS